MERGEVSPKGKGVDSIFQIYGGQIKDWRDQGQTLQQIGDRVGRSKERVRQILKSHYGSAKASGYAGYVSRPKLTNQIGCSYIRLKRLEEMGVVSPVKFCGWLFYSKDEIEKVVLALQRACLDCGTPFTVKHCTKYCRDCASKRRRNVYPFLNPEGKEKRKEATRRWIKKNPERWRAICRKAMAKYQAKKKEGQNVKSVESNNNP